MQRRLRQKQQQQQQTNNANGDDDDDEEMTFCYLAGTKSEQKLLCNKSV